MQRNLAIGAGALLLLAGVLWLMWAQPDREPVAFSAGELLADGIGHFERKEYAMALEVLRKVPDGLVESAQARYYEGSSHLMLKDNEAAIASLETALALEPRNPGVLYALGVAYYKLGNLAVAKGYFGAVLEINPNDEQAKGLMDIMAKLERESSVPAETE
jgi:tetratricopeptide (TPR) repeat protein